MNDSILNTIKKMLGITSDYTFFDEDIIADINSVLFILNQMGIGKIGFCITGPTEVWNQFLLTDTNLTPVITYVFMKTKLMFDPASSSTANDAYERQISELEWRLNISKE